MKRFEGRTVLVTGGALGIGRAIVKRFHSDGATVAFLDMAEDPAKELVEALNGEVHFAKADLTKEDEVETALADLAGRVGQIDILVNNSATAKICKSIDVSVDEWRFMFDTNVIGPATVTKHVVKSMRDAGVKGSIVNLGSIAATVGMAGQLSYNATKAAIISLTQGLAIDLKDDGIRVNAVSPCWTMTEAVRSRLYNDFGFGDAEVKSRIGDLHLSGRLAEPSEIAAVVAYIASDDASAINGANVMADHGYTTR